MPDDKILDRIRALLAKAEATDFPAEAETYATKAAELMARHNVEQAMIADQGRGPADPVESKVIVLDDPHAKVKALLLHGIATPMNCTTVYMSGGNGRAHRSTLFGHRSDIERVEFLYTSLLLQAIRMVGQVRPDEDQYHGWDYRTHAPRTKPAAATVAAYRRSWLMGFSNRIHQRLKEATAQAVRDTGSTGAELVLRSRLQDATVALREAHPRTRRTSFTAGRRDGYSAGHAAGSRADIGQRGVGSRRSAIAG